MKMEFCFDKDYVFNESEFLERGIFDALERYEG